jgi:hypothetical protein
MLVNYYVSKCLYVMISLDTNRCVDTLAPSHMMLFEKKYGRLPRYDRVNFQSLDYGTRPLGDIVKAIKSVNAAFTLSIGSFDEEFGHPK